MQFPTLVAPTLPLLGLSEDERALIERLQRAGIAARADMALTEAYYQGAYIVRNLRIAVQKELEFIRTIVGWPAVAVDPLVERLFVDGFRVHGATDSDDYLAELWEANGGDAEQSLAFTDALSMSHCYWSAGSPLESGGAPRITVDSPLNMSVLWDLRGLEARAALNEYQENGSKRGTLMVPGKAIHLAQADNWSQWEVVDRDEHDFDFVPVVRMSNKPRTANRNGSSEITPALMSLVDSACRTLLGLEVSREIYSVPQKIILGASEDAFVKTDGTPKSAWETYITKTLGLERDENGDLPDIKQLQAYDPSVFTKLIEMYASQAAGLMGAVPQDLGLYTEGNPTSADAAQVSESRRDRRAMLRQAMFGPSLTKVMQYAVRFDNKGSLPEEYRRISADWRDVRLESPATTSDAITKQITAGAIPATSDVTLKRLGYTAVERQRLEQDRLLERGRNLAATTAEPEQPQAE
ncbi:MAG: phage portal protein [Nocardioides sp.]|uniref:phage portal protein n=1 Tax=Nocardioides sp. TaxID=35761 RepID=UPI0039E4B82E